MRNRPEYIVVHYNGVAGRTIEDIRRTHRANGWRDVGYHYVILESGVIQRGRPENTAGAHARGLNARSIGVCMIDDNDADNGTWLWNVPQCDALIAKIAELQEAYGIPRDRVIGHREVNRLLPPQYHVHKPCPGSHVDMDQFRSWLPSSRGDVAA